MSDFPAGLGAPGKRNASAFGSFVSWLNQKIGALPDDYTAHANRVVSVNAGGTGLALTGTKDFGFNVVAGGIIKQFDMPAGNQTLSIANSGNRHASRSATAVTWTTPPVDIFTPYGIILPWVQCGQGKITFETQPTAFLINDDDQFVSGGSYSSGLLEYVDLRDGWRPVWILTGKMSA